VAQRAAPPRWSWSTSIIRISRLHRLEGAEEQKVASLVTGSKIVQKHMKAVMKACVNCEGSGDACFNPAKNPALKRRSRQRSLRQVPENYVKRVIQFAKQGYTEIRSMFTTPIGIPRPI
jgi:hypothetical protein